MVSRAPAGRGDVSLPPSHGARGEGGAPAVLGGRAVPERPAQAVGERRVLDLRRVREHGVLDALGPRVLGRDAAAVAALLPDLPPRRETVVVDDELRRGELGLARRGPARADGPPAAGHAVDADDAAVGAPRADLALRRVVPRAGVVDLRALKARHPEDRLHVDGLVGVLPLAQRARVAVVPVKVEPRRQFLDGRRRLVDEAAVGEHEPRHGDAGRGAERRELVADRAVRRRPRHDELVDVDEGEPLDVRPERRVRQARHPELRMMPRLRRAELADERRVGMGREPRRILVLRADVHEDDDVVRALAQVVGHEVRQEQALVLDAAHDHEERAPRAVARHRVDETGSVERLDDACIGECED